MVILIVMINTLFFIRIYAIIRLLKGSNMNSTELRVGLIASRSSSLTNKLKLNDKTRSTYGANALAFA